MKNEIQKKAEDISKKHNLKVSFMSNAIKKFKEDKRKTERKTTYMCKFCTYIEAQIGCSAITFSKCNICGSEIYNPSTNIDYCCLNCAEKHNVCVFCGGNMD